VLARGLSYGEQRQVELRGQCLGDVAPDEIGIAVPGELEHTSAGREHARVAVADDEAGLGCGVVVLEQLEEEAERAAAALDRLRRESVIAVEVDRALLAVRADEERHRLIVRTPSFAGR